MEIRLDRRGSEDRRQVHHHFSAERRAHTGNRRAQTGAHWLPDLERSLPQADADASSRAAAIVTKVAQAFGVDPDSLTAIEGDDFIETAQVFHSGEDPARQKEGLDEALAEPREESGRERRQVRDFLRAFNRRRQ